MLYYIISYFINIGVSVLFSSLKYKCNMITVKGDKSTAFHDSFLKKLDQSDFAKVCHYKEING